MTAASPANSRASRRGRRPGAGGLVSIRNGQPFSVGGLTIRRGKIVGMDILADLERVAQLGLTILDD
jgi:hypothetical protein